MAESANEKYDIQVISQRYIRKNVFEEYVNSKVDAFGDQWRCVWARDNKISFTALRKLSNDELDYLQERSQQANAPSNLFVD
ncbi:hypothetical protein IQ07DRAFT_647682 [Pyrenochaeta sp. DS3sAY3a]|nr:hypothetical protein IQ07DRAFT_647682 [Pyrenochaeta sp. DS3sAY3a]